MKIDDNVLLKKIEAATKNFSQQNEQLDVRGILILNYENQKIEYCFDAYGYFQRDGISFYNKQLLDILDEKARFWK